MTVKEYFEAGNEVLVLTDEMKEAFQAFIDYLTKEHKAESERLQASLGESK